MELQVQKVYKLNVHAKTSFSKSTYIAAFFVPESAPIAFDFLRARWAAAPTAARPTAGTLCRSYNRKEQQQRYCSDHQINLSAKVKIRAASMLT